MNTLEQTIVDVLEEARADIARARMDLFLRGHSDYDKVESICEDILADAECIIKFRKINDMIGAQK